MHSGNLGARKVRKSHMFVVITNERVLFRSLIAVYSDNHTEHIPTYTMRQRPS
jgi:hypothetical protein